MAKRVSVLIELLDSDNNVVAPLYEGTTSAELNIPRGITLNIHTGKLSSGYYGLKATFRDFETGALIASKLYPNAIHIREVYVPPPPPPPPEVPPEVPDVPDISMFGDPTTTLPESLVIGQPLSGMVSIPSMVPIAYSIGRQIYLEKGGYQYTVVPGDAIFVNPNTTLSVPVNFSTAGLEEGTYDIFLQVWDIYGNVFMLVDVGDLVLSLEGVIPEPPTPPEIPELPDASMFDDPVMNIPANIAMQSGARVIGNITLPNLGTLKTYNVGYLVRLRKAGETFPCSDGSVAVGAGAPMVLPVDQSVNNFGGRGTYQVLLTVTPDLLSNVVVGEIRLYEPEPELPSVPNSSMFGLPTDSIPSEILIGQVLNGQVSITSLVPTTYPIGRRVYVVKDGEETDIVSASSVNISAGTFTVPVNFNTEGMEEGTYDVYLEMWDVLGNVFLDIMLGTIIFTMSLVYPEVPDSSMFEAQTTLPDAEYIGNTWIGTIAVQNLVPIAYVIDREVYLEKGGVKTTVIPREEITVNPDTTQSLSISFDTSGLSEGKYDVFLKLYDQLGNAFLLFDIDKLIMSMEIPSLPTPDMIGSPILDIPLVWVKGSSVVWDGTISVPITAPIAYQFYTRLRLGPLSKSWNTNTAEDFILSIEENLSGFATGNYNITLEVSDHLGHLLKTFDLGVLEIKTISDLLGTPILNVPTILERGSTSWTGDITIPTSLPVDVNIDGEVKLYNDSLGRFTVGNISTTVPVNENIVIPISIPSSDLFIGDYDIQLSLNSAGKMIIRNLSLGILSVVDLLPSLPDASMIGLPQINIPTDLQIGDTITGNITIPMTTPVEYEFKGISLKLRKGTRTFYLVEDMAVTIPATGSLVFPINLTIPNYWEIGDWQLLLTLKNKFNQIIVSDLLLGILSIIPTPLSFDQISQVEDFLTQLSSSTDLETMHTIYSNITSSGLPSVIKTPLLDAVQDRINAFNYAEAFTNRFPDPTRCFSGYEGEISVVKPEGFLLINFDFVGMEQIVEFLRLSLIPQPVGIEITDWSDSGSYGLPGSRVKFDYRVAIGGIIPPSPDSILALFK